MNTIPKTKPALHPGDIVQIIDQAHKYYPALAIVSDPKGWGALAFCMLPRGNAGPIPEPIRLKDGQFVHCGVCALLSADMNRDRMHSLAAAAALDAESGQ